MSAQASYVTANSIRDNNTQMVNFTGARSFAAVAVNAADPYGGLCYGPGSNMPVTCAKGAGATWATWQQLQEGGTNVPALPTTCTDPHVRTTPCAYLLAENSLYATYNQVIPRFFSASLLDEWRPSDKWLINAGVRLDSFTFIGSNTDTGAARNFFTNAFNIDNCINSLSGVPTPKTGLGPGGTVLPPTQPCPTGYQTANWQNNPASVHLQHLAAARKRNVHGKLR